MALDSVTWRSNPTQGQQMLPSIGAQRRQTKEREVEQRRINSLTLGQRKNFLNSIAIVPLSTLRNSYSVLKLVRNPKVQLGDQVQIN